jgi:hypothetical protein
MGKIVQLNNLMLFSLLCSLSFFIVGEEEFVVPRKKRVSTSTMKERIAQRNGNIIKLSAKITEKNAQQEQDRIAELEELMQQDGASPFAKMNAQELQKYEDELKRLEDDIIIFEKKLSEHSMQLRRMKNNILRK